MDKKVGVFMDIVLNGICIILLLYDEMLNNIYYSIIVDIFYIFDKNFILGIAEDILYKRKVPEFENLI